MKRTSIVALSLLLTPWLYADAGQRLIPAGSLVSCTTGEARISSRSTAIGDPVLCKVGHRRGDFMLPYGSYLGGEFSEFKDPGHFVGKGFMKLDFDRLYVGDQVIPVDAKVVDVPGYNIDRDGRILGKGHAVRDTISWMIPILWPIDLINLPRRGPRPTLKAETAVTLRVMEDVEVPVTPEPQHDPYGLVPRGSSSYAPPPPTDDQQPAPQLSYDQPPEPAEPAEPPPAMAYAPPVMAYAPPVPVPYGVAVYPAPVVMPYAYAGPRVPIFAYAPRPYFARPYGAAYAPRPYAQPRAYGYGARAGYAPNYFAGRNNVGLRGGAGYRRGY